MATCERRFDIYTLTTLLLDGLSVFVPLEAEMRNSLEGIH